MLSNSNPAGQNQALEQHPLPTLGGIHVLGAAGTTIPFMPIGTTGAPVDTLLVAAPAAGSGVVRRIKGSVVGAFGYIINGSAAATTVGQIVYKDGSGNEVILNDFGAVGIGENNNFALDSTFFLTEDDAGGGLYVRLGATVAVAVAPAGAGYAQSEDVRGIERRVVSITDAKVGALPAVSYGEALAVFGGLAGTPVSCWLLNYDSVAHGADVVTTLADAAGEVVLPNGGDVAVGVGAPFLDADLVTGRQGQGENLNAVGVAPITTAPVLMTAFVRTNQGPVAPEQGGAY